MQQIRDITTEIWASTRALATDIDEDYDTVRKWFQRGRIPERAWPKMISKSAKTAFPLTADKLLQLNQPRKKRSKN